MNMAPDKKRSPDKIDDMAALYMAVGVALAAEEAETFSFEDAVQPLSMRLR